MLKENNFKENDMVAMRLNGGEEIIGKFVKQDEIFLAIKRALKSSVLQPATSWAEVTKKINDIETPAPETQKQGIKSMPQRLGGYSSIDSSKLDNVEIYDYEKGLITNSNNDGFFQFQDSRKKIKLVFYKLNYDYLIKTIDTDNPNSKIYHFGNSSGNYSFYDKLIMIFSHKVSEYIFLNKYISYLKILEIKPEGFIVIEWNSK